MAGGTRPDILTDAEYERMLGLLSGHMKGRIFLAEFARQARAEDTRALFAALASIESSLAVVREQLRPEVIAAEIGRIVLALRDELERAAPGEGDRSARQAAAMLKSCAELTALAQALSRGAAAGVLHAGEAEPAPAQAG